MDKDIIILRRIRYRFSKILEPVPLKDMKTFKILSIPPARKNKQDKIKIEEVTENVVIEEKLVSLEDEEASLSRDLQNINNNGFTLCLFSENDLLSREDYIDIEPESLAILRQKDRELNDPVLLGALRYILYAFLKEKVSCAATQKNAFGSSRKGHFRAATQLTCIYPLRN